MSGIIQTKLPADLLLVLGGGGELGQQETDRVPWQEPHHEEDDGDQPEDHGDRGRDPPGGVLEHGGVVLRSSAVR